METEHEHIEALLAEFGYTDDELDAIELDETYDA